MSSYAELLRMGTLEKPSQASSTRAVVAVDEVTEPPPDHETSARRARTPPSSVRSLLPAERQDARHPAPNLIRGVICVAFDTAPIELREVTADNFDSVIALQVADDQRGFLDTNVEALAWAYVAPECRPFAIYAGDTPVGFATYGYIPADGRCWIIHFMIDERWQQRGIGRAALEPLLARMAAESDGASLALGVNPDNAAAIRLYEAFGFRDTGRRQNGELIMRRAATRQEGAPTAGVDQPQTASASKPPAE